jgi:hypothetical protein
LEGVLVGPPVGRRSTPSKTQAECSAPPVVSATERDVVETAFVVFANMRSQLALVKNVFENFFLAMRIRRLVPAQPTGRFRGFPCFGPLSAIGAAIAD